jgi:hypothetical protein
MPERVLAPKAAVLGLDVRTLLDGTLAVANGHLFQTPVMQSEERAFSLEMLILYNFHD